MDDKKIIISRKELLVRMLIVLTAAYIAMCAFLNLNGLISVLGLYSKIGMITLFTVGVLVLLVYSIKIRKQIDKPIRSVIVMDVVLTTMWNIMIIKW